MTQATDKTVTADIIGGVALKVEQAILTIDVTISYDVEEVALWAELSTARSLLEGALRRLDGVSSKLRG